jgi:hypothetical protein
MTQAGGVRKAVNAGDERQRRVPVTHLGLSGGELVGGQVGRVRHQDVNCAAQRRRHGFQEVTRQNLHSVGAGAGSVLERQSHGRRSDVGAEDQARRGLGGHGAGHGARAGAWLDHDAACRDARDRLAREYLGLWSGDEHPWPDKHVQVTEPNRSDDELQWLPPRSTQAHGLKLGMNTWWQWVRTVQAQRGPGPIQHIRGKQLSIDFWGRDPGRTQPARKADERL